MKVKEGAITWKDVLDGGKMFHGNILTVYKLAKSAGYNYFTFNTKIYAITINNYYDTGLWDNILN